MNDIHDQIKGQQPHDLLDPVPVENKWCIIRGTPGTDPLTIIGPFGTSEDVSAYLSADTAESTIPAMVDVLVDPSNC